MRLVGAVVLLLALPLLPAGDAGAGTLQWADWATDPALDATLLGPAPSPEPRLDLVRLEVAADREYLHLRLSTAEPPALPAPPVEPPVPLPPLPAPSDPLGPPDAHVLLQAFVFGERGSGGNVYAESRDGRLLFHHAGRAIPETDYGFAPGSVPWSFHGWVRLRQLVGDEAPGTLELRNVTVGLGAAAGSDRMAGGRMFLYPAGLAGYAPSAVPLPGTWAETEGPDFAGGASVAIGPDGAPHLLYYQYEPDGASRGVVPGLYHARVGAAWEAERIGDYRNPAEARDHATRTRIAVAADGKVHGLYQPCPDHACGRLLSYVTDATGTWTVSQPFPEAGNRGRDVPDIAAAAGRVVAAVPLAGDRIALVERAGDGWRELHRLDHARLPKLALDAAGKAHLAWFQPIPGRHGQVDAGWLAHASEADGWKPALLVDGVVDQSGFWNPEVDGSFDMALDPAGRPCFAWDAWLGNDDAQHERGYGCLRDGTLAAEPAPFDTLHGNPQLAIRMAFDGAGNAHLGTGYGGTDLYLVRTAAGAWGAQAIQRHDVWDFAVARNGVPVFAYTQPHGGTTAAVSVMPGGPDPAGATATPGASGEPPVARGADGQDGMVWHPAPAAEARAAPAALLAPLVGLAAAIALRRRR